MGLMNIELKRIALMEEQVLEWGLPPAPSKQTDTRVKNWDGIGQVELDAVEPEKIVELCEEAIEDVFDRDLYEELMSQEKEEQKEYKAQILKDFKSLLD